MLIDGDDISKDFITLGRCFSMFVYIHACFPFALIGGLQLSWQGAKGELEVEFMYQRRSCKQAFSQTLKTGHPEGMFSHKIIRG